MVAAIIEDLKWVVEEVIDRTENDKLIIIDVIMRHHNTQLKKIYNQAKTILPPNHTFAELINTITKLIENEAFQ